MAAHQALLTLGFSRQEHWSGLPFPSPMHESEKWKWSRSVVSNSWRPHGLQPTRLLCPWDFPGKDAGVGCHFLVQGIFPTRGLNPGLLHCRQILYPLSHQGRPNTSISKNIYVFLWKKYYFLLFNSTDIMWSEGCSVLSDSVTLWTVQLMEFSRPEYWSEYPFPSLWALPNPGLEPRSSTLQAHSLPAEPQEKPTDKITTVNYWSP